MTPDPKVEKTIADLAEEWVRDNWVRYGCPGHMHAFRAGYEACEEKMSAEIEKLKWQLSQFKPYGTDACYNDETCMGRITLFRANAFCMTCKPEDYQPYELRSKERG